MKNETPRGISSALTSRIMDAPSQTENVVIDARDQPGMTKAVAEDAMDRIKDIEDQRGERLKKVVINTPKVSSRGLASLERRLSQGR